MSGRTPTTREFNKFSKIGKAGTSALRFGDKKWDNACLALGYTPPKRVPPPKIGGWNKGINRADVNLNELMYLYEIEGLPMAAIAIKLGISHNTIRRRMDLAGIKVRRHYYSQPRQTVPETLLYEELERQRIPFMKQQPIDGLYVVDVLVPGAKIVIECDGDYRHRPDDKDIARRDQKKTKYLESRGYLVFRFWESEIKENVTKCVERISESGGDIKVKNIFSTSLNFEYREKEVKIKHLLKFIWPPPGNLALLISTRFTPVSATGLKAIT